MVFTIPFVIEKWKPFIGKKLCLVRSIPRFLRFLFEEVLLYKEREIVIDRNEPTAPRNN